MSKRTLLLFLNLFIFSPFLGAQQDSGQAEWTRLETMVDLKTWAIAADKGGTGKLVKEDGPSSNKVLALRYNFGPGSWIEAGQGCNFDFSQLQDMKFSYKGTGDPNTLEFRLMDDSGSIFGIKIPRASLQNDWTPVVLTKADFIYLYGGNGKINWKSVRKIIYTLSKESGGKGQISIDPIQYRAAAKITNIDVVMAVVPVDNFERSDPYRVYKPFGQDDSVLSLQASREYQMEGNYSMEFDYSLSTKKSHPSSVSALYESKNPLDWTGVEELRIWVRGDGTGNVFRINLCENAPEGEIWTYENGQVLYKNDWQELVIPLGSFKLASWSKTFNEQMDLSKIIRFEFMIAGKTTEFSKGTVYIDRFLAKGKVTPSKVTPKEVMRVIELERPQGNIDFKGDILAQYSYTPELGNRVLLGATIIADAKVGKFKAHVELASENLPVGKDAYLVNQFTPNPFPVGSDAYIQRSSYSFYLRETRPAIQLSAVRIGMKDPVSFIKDISIGSLRENFSDYTYSQWHANGDWGYKGLLFNGGVSMFFYRGMIIKELNDSFVAAAEAGMNFDPFTLKGIYVYDNTRGHITNTGYLNQSQLDAGATGGNRGNFNTAGVYVDQSGSVELRADWKVFKLGLIFARDDFVRTGVGTQVLGADGTLQDYQFSYALTNAYRSSGNFFKGEIEIRNVPIEEFVLYGYVKFADSSFHPTYRASPQSFDEVWSDVKGFHIRISQGWRGWVPSFEIDQVQRQTNSSYRRTQINWGIDKYGLYGFDLSFSQDYRDQHNDLYYEYWLGRTPNMLNKHEKVLGNTIRVTYNFTSTFRLTGELRIEQVDHPAPGDGKTFYGQTFHTWLNFNVTGNATLRLEYMNLQYGDKFWEPHDEPFNENFFLTSFELTF
jgi:hypothetical protein